jgi:serine/threonine protein kinase
MEKLIPLDHEHLLKYYGVRFTEISPMEGAAEILMDYAPGGNLIEARQAYHQMSEKLLSKYVNQILSALHYLDQNGMTHR